MTEDIEYTQQMTVEVIREGLEKFIGTSAKKEDIYSVLKDYFKTHNLRLIDFDFDGDKIDNLELEMEKQNA